MGDMFVAFINYGDLDLPNTTTTDPFINTRGAVRYHPQGLPLNIASFIIGKYFLVVYKVLCRETLYMTTGYHLGRK
jgi:hypothetical protein